MTGISPSLLLFPFLGLITAHKQATGVGQMLLIPYGKNENCIPKLKDPNLII